MVKLRFIIRTGVLALRISEGSERYYKRVTHLLQGCQDLRHWKQDKEMFSARAEFYKENNQILKDFKGIYWRLITQHPELNAKQVANFYKPQQKANLGSQPIKLDSWSVEDYRNSVSKYLEVIIQRERAKQGCNFEVYYKLLRRCRRDIVGFDEMPLSTIDYNQMVTIANIFAGEPSYRQMSKTFRALLGKAHKDPNVMFRLEQIGDFRFCDYNPNKYDLEMAHPDVLNAEQLKQFLNCDPYYLTPGYKNRNEIMVYYDFCVFMFHSFFAPCDVLKAKAKDITNRGTLMIRRKKTHRPVEVPISPVMKRIIEKYRGQSKYGYIFPIMDDKKDKESGTKDYCLKTFREKLNNWLKPVGETLETEFKMRAYVFRHTAITVAIDSGVPVSYVANAAGTSIEMIQKHYYNGDNQQNRNLLAEAFAKAAI